MASVPVKAELKVDMEVFRQIQGVRRKLFGIMKKIKGIDAEVKEKQTRLDELSGLSGTFRLKEKKELMNSISDLIIERTRQSSMLKETVNAAGYRSVDSFMRAFDKSHTLVEEYLKMQDADVNKSNSSTQMQEKKQSVLDKLHKYDQEAKQSNSSSKRRRIVPKTGMEIE